MEMLDRQTVTIGVQTTVRARVEAGRDVPSLEAAQVLELADQLQTEGDDVVRALRRLLDVTRPAMESRGERAIWDAAAEAAGWWEKRRGDG
jgi:hypothetical protein